MESRNSSKLQITLLRYDIHIVAGLFVLQYIPDYLALTEDLSPQYGQEACVLVE